MQKHEAEIAVAGSSHWGQLGQITAILVVTFLHAGFVVSTVSLSGPGSGLSLALLYVPIPVPGLNCFNGLLLGFLFDYAARRVWRERRALYFRLRPYVRALVVATTCYVVVGTVGVIRLQHWNPSHPVPPQTPAWKLVVAEPFETLACSGPVAVAGLSLVLGLCLGFLWERLSVGCGETER